MCRFNKLPHNLLSYHLHWGKCRVGKEGGEAGGGRSLKANMKHNFFLNAEDKIPAVGHLAATLLTAPFLYERKQFLRMQMMLQTD